MAYELLETCLGVPGISISNCASWVQAWGSVGAILVSVGIVQWQHVRTERSARKANEERAIQRALALHHLIDGAADAAALDGAPSEVDRLAAVEAFRDRVVSVNATDFDDDVLITAMNRSAAALSTLHGRLKHYYDEIRRLHKGHFSTSYAGQEPSGSDEIKVLREEAQRIRQWIDNRKRQAMAP